MCCVLFRLGLRVWRRRRKSKRSSYECPLGEGIACSTGLSVIKSITTSAFYSHWYKSYWGAIHTGMRGTTTMLFSSSNNQPPCFADSWSEQERGARRGELLACASQIKRWPVLPTGVFSPNKTKPRWGREPAPTGTAVIRAGFRYQGRVPKFYYAGNGSACCWQAVTKACTANTLWRRPFYAFTCFYLKIHGEGVSDPFSCWTLDPLNISIVFMFLSYFPPTSMFFFNQKSLDLSSASSPRYTHPPVRRSHADTNSTSCKDHPWPGQAELLT